MFYLIETNYIGPDDRPNADRVVIAEEPVTGVSSRQPVIEGWAGSFNSTAYYGRGAYETLDAARAAVADLLGEHREVEAEPDEIEAFCPGKYPSMTFDEAADWIAAGGIDVSTATDEALEALAEELEQCANENDGSLGGRAMEVLQAMREDA